MNAKFLLTTILIFLFTLSCNFFSGDKELKSTETEIAVDSLKKYICPMMCNEGKFHPGVCDVCEMDLVLNENYKE